jgi:hypothetical protein
VRSGVKLKLRLTNLYWLGWAQRLAEVGRGPRPRGWPRQPQNVVKVEIACSHVLEHHMTSPACEQWELAALYSWYHTRTYRQIRKHHLHCQSMISLNAANNRNGAMGCASVSIFHSGSPTRTTDEAQLECHSSIFTELQFGTIFVEHRGNLSMLIKGPNWQWDHTCIHGVSG